MAGPNKDHLQYTQATAWYPRIKVLTATPEPAVVESEAVLEGCGNVKEIQVFALSGTVSCSNREDGTFFDIEEGGSFLFPLDYKNNVWIKGGTALVVATGFPSTAQG